MTKSVDEMTNEEFFRFVVDECLEGWIPLKAYLRVMPEETKIAIETRIKRKHWVRGVHYHTPPGSFMWVNLRAIRRWASGQS